MIEPLGSAPRIGLPNVLVNNMASCLPNRFEIGYDSRLMSHSNENFEFLCLFECAQQNVNTWTLYLVVRFAEYEYQIECQSMLGCSGSSLFGCECVCEWVCVCVWVCVCGGREREREAQQKKEAETKKERHGGRNTKNKKSSNITWYDRGNETYLTRCEVWIRSHLCDIHISIVFCEVCATSIVCHCECDMKMSVTTRHTSCFATRFWQNQSTMMYRLC